MAYIVRSAIFEFSGATVDENSVPPWTRGDFRKGLGEPPLKAVFMLPGGASVSSSFSSSVFWEGTSEDEHDDEDDF